MLKVGRRAPDAPTVTITQGNQGPAPAAAAAGHVAAPAEALIAPYLRALVDLRGSDLHCKAGSPPRIRIDGRLRALQAPALTADVTERMLEQILRPDLVEEFARTHEADFAYSLPHGAGRFRVNAFRQRGSVGLVLRRVAAQAVPLAGMIDHINTVRESHIVTIEDPIEVLHTDNRSMISQREVRLDTADFTTALRAAMRQDPDVILVGEMRDQETVKAALSAAETGHFVMSTLHTIDAAETIARIIDFFPPHEQKQVRLALAGSLRGIVCQRLVPRADGAGRCVVMEVCVNTGRIADAISDPDKTSQITDLIREGQYYRMQTFDQHLVALVRDGVVTLEDAQDAASSPHDLAVELRRLGLVA